MGGVGAIFSCCGVSLFWGEKGERKEGEKFFGLIQLHQYYEKDAKNPHHSSQMAII
jgi:hypothetical protein